jgi:hypothetical protein
VNFQLTVVITHDVTATVNRGKRRSAETINQLPVALYVIGRRHGDMFAGVNGIFGSRKDDHLPAALDRN